MDNNIDMNTFRAFIDEHIRCSITHLVDDDYYDLFYDLVEPTANYNLKSITKSNRDSIIEILTQLIQSKDIDVVAELHNKDIILGDYGTIEIIKAVVDGPGALQKEIDKLNRLIFARSTYTPWNCYVVSDWLFKKLQAEGEKVVDAYGLNIWGCNDDVSYSQDNVDDFYNVAVIRKIFEESISEAE